MLLYWKLTIPNPTPPLILWRQHTNTEHKKLNYYKPIKDPTWSGDRQTEGFRESGWQQRDTHMQDNNHKTYQSVFHRRAQSAWLPHLPQHIRLHLILHSHSLLFIDLVNIVIDSVILVMWVQGRSLSQYSSWVVIEEDTRIIIHLCTSHHSETSEISKMGWNSNHELHCDIIGHIYQQQQQNRIKSALFGDCLSMKVRPEGPIIPTKKKAKDSQKATTHASIVNHCINFIRIASERNFATLQCNSTSIFRSHCFSSVDGDVIFPETIASILRVFLLLPDEAYCDFSSGLPFRLDSRDLL